MKPPGTSAGSSGFLCLNLFQCNYHKIVNLQSNNFIQSSMTWINSKLQVQFFQSLLGHLTIQSGPLEWKTKLPGESKKRRNFVTYCTKTIFYAKFVSLKLNTIHSIWNQCCSLPHNCWTQQQVIRLATNFVSKIFFYFPW